MLSIGVARAAGPKDCLRQKLIAISQAPADSKNLRMLQESIEEGRRHVSRHSMVIKNGRAVVDIAHLQRQFDFDFMQKFFAALSAGEISEVSAGTITGPKVLALLTRIPKIVPSGSNTVVHGVLDLQAIETNLKMQLELSKTGSATTNLITQSVFDKKTKQMGLVWSARDAREFEVALRELNLSVVCRDLRGTTDLSECGPLRFRMNTNRPDHIDWSIADRPKIEVIRERKW